MLETTYNSILVSIGIANYNYAKYIIEALNSVAAQTYSNIEILIIDDCSTDNSVEVIEEWITKYKGSFKVKFIKSCINQGISEVCNKVLQNATGKYFQILDADDILLPEKIEKQVFLLENSTNTALIYSNILMIDELGKDIPSDYFLGIGYNQDDMPQGSILGELLVYNFIPMASVLINTDCAKVIGGFDATLHLQDYYLWLKLAERYKIIYHPEKTAMYRIHSNSFTNNSLRSPKLNNSILHTKIKYYDSSNKSIQKVIRSDIHSIGVSLYKCNYPTARAWLKRNVLLTPGIKSISYFIAINLGIKYKWIPMIKHFTYDYLKRK